MKFALCVPQEFYEHYHAHPFEISGLLQWAKVLDGDVTMITDDHSKYDVIMTNVSSTESEYISVLRQEVPDAKIIACFDYGFSVVNQYFLNLDRVKQVMNRSDHIFSVNKNQVEWMKLLFPDKDIRYIPHPTDTENMRRYRRPLETKEPNTVAAFWHQYDNYQLQPLEVLKAVERRVGHPLFKVLVGLKSRIMQQQGVNVLTHSFPVVSDDYPEASLRGQPLDPELMKSITRAPKGVSWDSVLPYMGVEGWYSALSTFPVALDMYTVDSIGRFGMDCAGVGVPLVASSKQDTSKLLWPLTTIDPFEPFPAVAFTAKLLKDSEFMHRTLKIADKNLENYGFAKSKERMMRVLEESQ